MAGKIIRNYTLSLRKCTDRNGNPYYTRESFIPGFLSLQNVVIYAFANVIKDEYECLDMIIKPNQFLSELVGIKELIDNSFFSRSPMDKITIRLSRRNEDGIVHYTGLVNMPMIVDMSQTTIHVFPIMGLGGAEADLVFRFYEESSNERIDKQEKSDSAG
jgi:hypothetical protein